MLLFASITNNSPTHWKLAVDDTLILIVSEGDKEAFTALYKLTSKSEYAYALSILKNPSDAEDVLQDTFLKVRSAATLYQSKGKLLAWILTISRNLCLLRNVRLLLYMLSLDGNIVKLLSFYIFQFLLCFQNIVVV